MDRCVACGLWAVAAMPPLGLWCVLCVCVLKARPGRGRACLLLHPLAAALRLVLWVLWVLACWVVNALAQAGGSLRRPHASMSPRLSSGLD